LPNDVLGVSVDPEAEDRTERFLELYDQALPEVYGYLLHRCGDVSLAEDLTSEVFLAAARTVRWGGLADLTVAWLIAVARNKLVDHWRRRAREERGLQLAARDASRTEAARFDAVEEGRAHATLRRLPAQYRAALTLRYVDGLSVPAVAAEMGRTLHAAESLLARGRSEFRRLYMEADDD
jgi:RNA polymerase sigma-70 factor (ECF subfamily)